MRKCSPFTRTIHSMQPKDQEQARASHVLHEDEIRSLRAEQADNPRAAASFADEKWTAFCRGPERYLGRLLIQIASPRVKGEAPGERPGCLAAAGLATTPPSSRPSVFGQVAVFVPATAEWQSESRIAKISRSRPTPLWPDFYSRRRAT